MGTKRIVCDAGIDVLFGFGRIIGWKADNASPTRIGRLSDDRLSRRLPHFVARSNRSSKPTAALDEFWSTGRLFRRMEHRNVRTVSEHKCA